MREETVTAQDEACRTHVVEIEVFELITRHLAVLCYHPLRIAYDVVLQRWVLVSEISIHDTLQLDAHNVAPLTFLVFDGIGEVQIVWRRIALHFAQCQPLGVMVAHRLGEKRFAVDAKVLEVDVMTLSRTEYLGIGNAVEGAILDIDIVDVGAFLKTVELHGVA